MVKLRIAENPVGLKGSMNIASFIGHLSGNHSLNAPFNFAPANFSI
jgi:hypothetical protein